MTPDEAFATLKRWRSRDDVVNMAIRSVLDAGEWNTLADVYAADPELVVLMYEQIAPLRGMEDEFAAVDEAQRGALREQTGRDCPECGGLGYFEGDEVEVAPGVVQRPFDRPCETCRRLIRDE
jgi:hypothetical protein